MLLEFENFDVLPEIFLEGLKLSNDCIRGGAVKTPVTDYILFTWFDFHTEAPRHLHIPPPPQFCSNNNPVEGFSFTDHLFVNGDQ